MPIHDVGYREWNGTRAPRIHGWFVMLLANITILRRNLWLRRALAAAWLPTLYIGVGFYALETLLHSNDTETKRFFANAFGTAISVPPRIVDVLQSDLVTPEVASEVRHVVWASLISTFLSYPQALAAMIIIGMIAPSLIARDLRTRAYLIYFSKPIGTWEYLLGKYLTVMAFVSAVTLLPAVTLFLFGVGLSPDLGVLWDTWDLPLRTILASLVFMIPTTTIALTFSSMTSESRYAAIGWFAFWILGFAAWQLVYAVRLRAMINQAWMVNQVDGTPVTDILFQQIAVKAADSSWSLLSLYESISRVQRWIIGSTDQMPTEHLILLVCVTLASLLLLVRRVNAPLRV